MYCLPIFATILVLGAVLETGVKGQIVPDTSASYSSCPACEVSSPAGTQQVQATMAVVTDWTTALASRDPNTVADVFCENATLTGTMSQEFRIGRDQIYSYFDYFARQNNSINSVCPQVIQLVGPMYMANVAVNLSSDGAEGCLRMSFVVDIGAQCVQNLYSSQFPNNPEALRRVDAANGMPWSTPPNNGSVPGLRTALGSCQACETKIVGNIPESVSSGVKDAVDAWVNGLLDQNSTSIINTYCNSSFLWGTVSNMRRNGLDEVQSYFDWFAPSQDFQKTIRSVCATITDLNNGLYSADRQVLVGDQCLRMSYMIVEEGGRYCIKSLSSSYFPAEPAALMEADAKNGMPWATSALSPPTGSSTPYGPDPASPPSSARPRPVAMASLVYSMIASLFIAMMVVA